MGRTLSRRWYGSLTVLIFASIFWASTASSDLVPPFPKIKAAAAIVVQAQCGAILYEKNAFEARPPASLTKMITALVVMDRCGLDEVAVVSAHAASAPGSSLGLREGDRITVGELIKGLLLPSGNDVAVCLAEHVAGSEAAFAELMNAKAAELGAINTHLENASGLTAEGHYSCARDLAIFAMAVRLNPYLAEVVSQAATVVKWSDGRTKRVDNLNRLLARYTGCNGVKTGFTTPAGRCLAASATRNGYSVVSVVLRSPDAWAESARLLDWTFVQPPVGVVEVAAPGGVEPARLAGPIYQDALYVPVEDFMRALGCEVETRESAVVVRIREEEITFSEQEGVAIESLGSCPNIKVVRWRGRLVVATAPLCRLLGLRLSFDKQALTALVEAMLPENVLPPSSRE